MDYKKLLKEEELIKLSLVEGKMHYLLTEELSKSDISDMESALKDAREKFKTMVTNLENTGLGLTGDVKGYAAKLLDAIDRGATALTELELEDPEGMADTAKRFFGQSSDLSGIMRAVSAIQSKVAEFNNGLGGALDQMKSIAARFEYTDEEQKKPLKDVFGTGAFPPVEKLAAAIKKQLSNEESWMSKLPGAGMMKKLGNLFKRGKGVEDKILDNLGDLPDFSGLADAVLSLTPEKLAALGKEVEAALQDQPEPVPTEIISQVTDGAPGGEGGAAGGAAGGGGGGAAPSSVPSADADAARQAADQAAEEAKDAPLGAGILSIIDAFAEELGDVEGVGDKITSLKDEIKGGMGAAGDGLTADVKEKFGKFFDDVSANLDDAAKDALKDPVASVGTDVVGLVDGQLKVESRRRYRMRLVEMLRDNSSPSNDLYIDDVNDDSIKRWSRLAGLTDE